MIHATIKAAVEARGLTAYRVAKQAGVSVDTVARFLSGERDMRTRSLDAVCRALGLVLTDSGPSGGPDREDAATVKPGAEDRRPAEGPPPAALHTEAVGPGEGEPEAGGEASPGLPTDADAPLQDLAPVARKRTNSREFVAKASSPGTRRFLASNGATKQELGQVDAPTDTLALKLARGRWPAHSRFLKVREAGPC